MDRQNILIVSADRERIALITDGLKAAGFALHILGRQERLAETIKHNRPVLVLIDWSLPDRSALTVLRQLREELTWRKPVIVIGQQIAPDDVMLALDMGADLCLAEICQPRVFVARVGAMLRREGLRAADGS